METETVKVRALIGNWEGQEPMMLGAIQHDQYEAILEDDENEGGRRWAAYCELWKDRGPHGVDETREVDIDLQVPADLFSTPQLSAS